MSPSYLPLSPGVVLTLSMDNITSYTVDWATSGTATTTVQYIDSSTTADWSANLPRWKVTGRRRPVFAPQDQTQPRRPPPREFNRYINASDLMEDFIRWAGQQGVRKGEVLSLPIDLFVKWLITEACRVDQVEPDVVLELPAPRRVRCLGCGRFMARASSPLLHDQRCAGFYFARRPAAA